MNADENANPEAAPIAVDLYCPNCEYNLRGLSGDPVRCPECGKASMRKELDYAPRMVERRTRKMENSGAVCFLTSAAAIACLVFSIATAEFGCVICGLCVLPIISPLMRWRPSLAFNSYQTSSKRGNSVIGLLRSCDSTC